MLLHLLGVVGATRRLVSLGRIKVLQVRGWEWSSAAGKARRVWSTCWASWLTRFYREESLRQLVIGGTDRTLLAALEQRVE